MPVDFTAIDFETANSSSASACSVGLVRVRDGQIVDRAEWLIKPPPGHDAFHGFNVHLHGISAEMVADALDWESQLDELTSFVGDDVVVAHNAGFDMGVIRATCSATITPVPRFRYVCSVQVARKTYELESYSLPFASAAAGFGEFEHHDALADAAACAAIIIDAAARHTASSVSELARLTGVKVARLKAIPLKL